MQEQFFVFSFFFLKGPEEYFKDNLLTENKNKNIIILLLISIAPKKEATSLLQYYEALKISVCCNEDQVVIHFISS